jgi:Uma2 family endonuclease
MNHAFRKSLTLAEFLDWEQRQELRYEFAGFQPVAMTGGTAAHAGIEANLATALNGRLRGKPCAFFGSNLKIEVAGRIRYPGGFVVCSPAANTSTIVADPVVIFEILSPSKSSTDRILKNREYEVPPSVQHYVILEQDRLAATVFARAGDDWVGHILLEDAILAMPEIGLEVPLAEFDEGLALDEAEENRENA